jgi:hypothetical protein
VDQGWPDVGQAHRAGIAWDLVTSEAIALVHVVSELLARCPTCISLRRGQHA